MKKGIYIIVSVSLVVVGAIYYLMQSKNTIKKEFNLAAHSVAEFDYIRLCNSRDTIILNKINETWHLNHSMQASKLKVTLMLDVLESLTVNNPVTGRAGEDIKDEIKKNGVAISCYSNGKEVYNLSFISDPKNGKGSYGYKRNHKFVVQVSTPGHSGHLQKLFRVDEFYWQSNTLFSSAPEQIDQIQIDWNNHKGESFSIVNHEGATRSIMVDGVDKTSQADLNKLKFYLYEFRSIDLLDKKDKYKNIKGEYLCTITLTTKDYSTSAEMYKMISAEGKEDNAFMVVHIAESNVWGSVNYLKMAPIMKKALFFMKAN